MNHFNRIIYFPSVIVPLISLFWMVKLLINNQASTENDRIIIFGMITGFVSTILAALNIYQMKIKAAVLWNSLFIVAIIIGFYPIIGIPFVDAIAFVAFASQILNTIVIIIVRLIMIRFYEKRSISELLT